MKWWLVCRECGKPYRASPAGCVAADEHQASKKCDKGWDLQLELKK